MKDKIIPFNVLKALFVLINALLCTVVGFIGVYIFKSNINANSLFLLVCALIIIWIIVYFFKISFHNKIIFKEHYFLITQCNKSKLSKVNLPILRKDKIFYKDIQKYGIFFTKEIKEYCTNKNGLINEFLVIGSGGIPIQIKLPLSIKNLKDVFMIITKDSNVFLLETSSFYSLKQGQHLLYKLEEKTNIQSSGAVVACKNNENIIWAVIKSFCILIWFGWPISVLFITKNSLAVLTDSIRFFAFFAFFCGNFALAAYYSSKRIEKNEQKLVKKFKYSFYLLYSIGIILFYVFILLKP